MSEQKECKIEHFDANIGGCAHYVITAADNGQSGRCGHDEDCHKSQQPEEENKHG